MDSKLKRQVHDLVQLRVFLEGGLEKIEAELLKLEAECAGSHSEFVDAIAVATSHAKKRETPLYRVVDTSPVSPDFSNDR